MQPSSAVKIVQLELEYGSDDFIAADGFDIPKINTILDLELYDNETPVTVANFLNYVRSGRYDLTFFNRSIPGFVLQTGGVNNISTDPDNESLGTSFGEVEVFLPILNEPGLSNIRGSIAMAKRPDQPDSANSPWFINLNDNRDSLDTSNGGFTVFGSVIDDGMEIADQVETFAVFDAESLFGPSYSDVPLADFGESVFANASQSNLVMILRAIEISRPILRFFPVDGNFGIDVFSDDSGKLMDVTLKNTGNQALAVEAIRVDAINEPFSILSENCSNTSLMPVSVAPESFCTLSLQFLPVFSGKFNDSLIVDYTSQANGGSFSVKYHLLGEGSAVGVPEISIVNTLDVGSSQVDGFSIIKTIKVNNTGQSSLQVVGITGLSLSDFSQANDCTGSAAFILPGASCEIAVSFVPSDFGRKTATLSVQSNDPVNNVVDIELSGFGASDSDGIVSAIENAAPNEGDGNFDGITDSQQNNVASYSDLAGEYISLIVDVRNVISNVSVTLDEPDENLPAGIIVKHGILEYDVILSPPGAIIEIGLILPPGEVPNAYYFFGITANNQTPHWYKYPETQVLPNVTLSSSVQNLIKLSVQDGGAGDADQKVNGIIRISPGVISYASKGGSGGFINIIFIFYMFVLIIAVRRYR